MDFTKYEAAGNTYIIINKDGSKLSAERASNYCHPIYGAGSDGVICWATVDNREKCAVQVDIYNPDGSMAEKSGNGLRILATFLFDTVFQNIPSLQLVTLSGTVVATRPKHDKNILLEMGIVTSQSGPNSRSNEADARDGIMLETRLGSIFGYPVSIGNPHFVIFDDELSAEKAHALGPLVENHPYFPNRTNVQFAKVMNREQICAEIWERGAGYTLSSGSSSCAIAAVAHRLGLCNAKVAVSMAGGQLKISISSNGTVYLTGPVNKTVEGVFIH